MNALRRAGYGSAPSSQCNRRSEQSPPVSGGSTGTPHNPIREGLPTNRELSPTFMDGPSDSNYSGFDAISVRAVIR